MKRQNISSGAPWEKIVGYSRAVRIGYCIEISGTTSADNGMIIGKNDPYLQTKTILQKIAQTLTAADAEMKDVIRTRIYVTDISRWKEVAKAHLEFFKDIEPATSMVEVSKLIDPDMMVEIEVTAISSKL